MDEVTELVAETIVGDPCTHLREAFELGETTAMVEQSIWKKCPVCNSIVVFEPK